MSTFSEQEMLDAVTTRDQSYDGHFFYGVMTTGIFCQPSCPSRTANPENLRFYPTIKTAMEAGFRPCKRCQPTGDTSRAKQLVQLARHIEAHADEKLTLDGLGKMIDLSASRLQRVFKASFGISPKAYQDAIRMQRFKQSLKGGDGVTEAIFSSGFGSISRVYGETSRNIGMTPKAYRAGGANEIITYACRNTALGLMIMAATARGVCFVQFGDRETTLIAQLAAEFPNATLNLSPTQHAPELDHWMEALDQHMSAGSARPDLPLDIRGTAFQMQVWQFLLSVREGDVLSYSELAKGINRPKAVRAVASACAANRIGVLIPCHRVIRGDGSLGGYRWGLARKRTLLEQERNRKTDP